MTKNKENVGTAIAIGIIVSLAGILGIITIATLIGRTRSAAAQYYDLECLTEPRENPLVECKEAL